MFQRRVFKKLHDPRTAKLRIARNIDVIRAAVFQWQPNTLAAALDGWLIVELITHGSPPLAAKLAHIIELVQPICFKSFQSFQLFQAFKSWRNKVSACSDSLRKDQSGYLIARS